MGVGPAIVLLTLAYIVVATLVARAVPAASAAVLHHGWEQVLGRVLLVSAAVLYVPTITRVRRAAEQERLITDGLFAHVRNPIYALFIFLVCPAVALVAGTWVVLATPFVAYGLYRLLIPREEAGLRARFGEAYEAYRRRVPGLVPRLHTND
jgi:protein-S-isoprenylcysteine O-methyltransferase Ste14